MCVISPHNSVGMVSPMWCQIVKLSPAPNDMFAQSEIELFQIDRFARLYGIQKLLRRREILECVQNLISPCITSVCKKKVSPHNLLGSPQQHHQPSAAKSMHFLQTTTSHRFWQTLCTCTPLGSSIVMTLDLVTRPSCSTLFTAAA